MLLVPFALGLIASQIFQLRAALTALLLILGLLFFLRRGSVSGTQGKWQVLFFLCALCLGGLYGAKFIERTPQASVKSLVAPREEVFLIEPVQTFLAPPYSSTEIGIGKQIDRDALLYFSAPAGLRRAELPRGFQVELYGVKKDLESSIRDPDFRSYLENRGVGGSVDSLRPGRLIGVENLFRAVFAGLLWESKQALSAGASPLDPATRVYQALALGQRTGLDATQKKAFRDTGTAHLFAISGLHVGLVGGFLFGFFRILRVRTSIQVSGMLSILLFYVILTGASPSAVRAFLMIAFLVGAKVFQRAYCPASALAASALVVLLIDPGQLFTLGFQLSYTVVLSILVFGVPLTQLLLERTDPEYWLPGQSGSPFHRTRRWLFGSFSISLAAFLGSSPLIMDHFQILPISSILLNLLLIFPATLALLLGFLSLLFGLLGALWISAPLNAIARIIIESMTFVVSSAAEISFTVIPISFANSWTGAVGTLLFLGGALWVGSRETFRIRHILVPFGTLFLTILLGVIP